MFSVPCHFTHFVETEQFWDPSLYTTSGRFSNSTILGSTVFGQPDANSRFYFSVGRNASDTQLSRAWGRKPDRQPSRPHTSNEGMSCAPQFGIWSKKKPGRIALHGAMENEVANNVAPPRPKEVTRYWWIWWHWGTPAGKDGSTGSWGKNQKAEEKSVSNHQGVWQPSRQQQYYDIPLTPLEFLDVDGWTE